MVQPWEGRMEGPTDSILDSGESLVQGSLSISPAAAKRRADGPDTGLVAVIVKHMEALLEEQAREIERGGGGSGDLTPRTVLRLQQHHLKLREAATLLEMALDRATGPAGETGRSSGETRWSPGETGGSRGETICSPGKMDSSPRGAETSLRESQKSPRERELVTRGATHAGPLTSVSMSEGFSPVLEAGFEGRDPTDGFHRPEHPTVGGQPRSERDQQIGGAEAQGILANESLLAARLRSLRQLKPVNQMTLDDFPELMDLFRRNSPATQPLPAESVLQDSGITHAPSAVQSSLAPSSPATSTGVKRPYVALEPYLPASPDSAPSVKRGTTEPSQTPDGVSIADGANAATLSHHSCMTSSPWPDGSPNTSAPEGSPGAFASTPSLRSSESQASPGHQRIDLNRAPSQRLPGE